MRMQDFYRRIYENQDYGGDVEKYQIAAEHTTSPKGVGCNDGGAVEERKGEGVPRNYPT